MSAARDQILARIRAANQPTDRRDGGPAGAEQADRDADAAYAALPRRYLRAHHDAAAHDIAALFAERAADYRAVVERVPGPGPPPSPRPSPACWPPASPPCPAPFVVPDGLPAGWRAGRTARGDHAGPRRAPAPVGQPRPDAAAW